MANIIAWHGKALDDHVKLRDDAAHDGYRFLSLSIHGPTQSPRYTAVMIKRPVVVAQRDWPLMSAAQFQQTFDEQAQQGYGPVIISAIGSGADPRCAAVFEPQDPLPLTRHGLRRGDDSDLGTIQGMNRKAKEDGLILRWATVYGDASEPRYAAVWVPNKDHTVWNADGVLESGSDFQARFDAEVSGWCRPSHITLNADQQYLSTFVDREIGPWVAAHGMTSDGYQSKFDALTQKGYFPIRVQGGGSGSSTRYAALFVKREDPLPQQFSPTGPATNADIDNVIHDAMTSSPVGHASLAIVHAAKLVYARGYTWGGPSWPVCQPTSRFRIASVSKLVTALAAYQLIAEGKLDFTETVQSILHLKTPSGGPPHDPRFPSVTVRHLLEHTAGIKPHASQDEMAILNAFKTQAPGSWHLPVTEAMCDAYVASLDMEHDPGQAQGYSNCGYYLLGRVVAKKRGVADPVDAYQPHLFDPLGIHRIRRASSLIAGTPADEARYRGDDIPVDRSVMSDARPLVPFMYGTSHLERKAGSGGLSAAATDLGRLIAILLSPNDNAAFKRLTLDTMLNNAVDTMAAWQGMAQDHPLAGHGLDAARTLGNHRYRGHKGGDLKISHNVVHIDGDWGFAMSWGGDPEAAGEWRPAYPAVMNIAKAQLASASDLFPSFGMPSL